MFSTLQKAKEIIEQFKNVPYEERKTIEYHIDLNELISICEDLLGYEECCDNNSRCIQSQANYIRLIEKENKELRGEK